MNIGLPKEVKDNEFRVGLVPAGVHALSEDGHTVFTETGAGEGSGFSDEEYRAAGATLVAGADDLFAHSELVVKVKEPTEEEYPTLHEGQILASFLHLAPVPELTRVLLEKQLIGVAYETIRDERGGLPLLTPMSEVAGRMSVTVGSYYLQRPEGGRGVLLGGVPGVRPAFVVILGGGTVGINAAKIALGLGAQVCILDVDIDQLRHIDDLFFGRIETLISNPYHIAQCIKDADLVIGAVLIPGSSAPKLITRQMVASMQPGSVIVDVAVDQGGCCETTRPTTHSDPVYQVDGVLHYCVSNMPGSMPRTSTLALTNATLPYIRNIANLGLKNAIGKNPYLKDGVNVYKGQVTFEPVAKSQNLSYRDLDELL
ncbi:alanine dehydrogenase [Acidobacteria bacterium AH-259-D05]|nr:alanine dehydrogenase [Acidobacteria bacterium AH-259-D05]